VRRVSCSREKIALNVQNAGGDATLIAQDDGEEFPPSYYLEHPGEPEDSELTTPVYLISTQDAQMLTDVALRDDDEEVKMIFGWTRPNPFFKEL
jgi:hypothetical protein